MTIIPRRRKKGDMAELKGYLLFWVSASPHVEVGEPENAINF